MKKNKYTYNVDVFTDLLKQNVPMLHKARLWAVAIFVLSLISEATVNLQRPSSVVLQKYNLILSVNAY